MGNFLSMKCIEAVFDISCSRHCLEPGIVLHKAVLICHHDRVVERCDIGMGFYFEQTRLDHFSRVTIIIVYVGHCSIIFDPQTQLLCLLFWFEIDKEIWEIDIKMPYIYKKKM